MPATSVPEGQWALGSFIDEPAAAAAAPPTASITLTGTHHRLEHLYDAWERSKNTPPTTTAAAASGTMAVLIPNNVLRGILLLPPIPTPFGFDATVEEMKPLTATFSYDFEQQTAWFELVASQASEALGSWVPEDVIVGLCNRLAKPRRLIRNGAWLSHALPSTSPAAAIAAAAAASPPTRRRGGPRKKVKPTWTWFGAGKDHVYNRNAGAALERAYVLYDTVKTNIDLLVKTATTPAELNELAKLKLSLEANKKCRVKIRGVWYTMDLEHMTQQNEQTGRVRPMRRQLDMGGGAGAGADAGGVAAAATAAIPAGAAPTPTDPVTAAATTTTTPAAAPVTTAATSATPPAPSSSASSRVVKWWWRDNRRGGRYRPFSDTDSKAIEQLYLEALQDHEALRQQFPNVPLDTKIQFLDKVLMLRGSSQAKRRTRYAFFFYEQKPFTQVRVRDGSSWQLHRGDQPPGVTAMDSTQQQQPQQLPASADPAGALPPPPPGVTYPRYLWAWARGKDTSDPTVPYAEADALLLDRLYHDTQEEVKAFQEAHPGAPVNPLAFVKTVALTGSKQLYEFKLVLGTQFTQTNVETGRERLVWGPPFEREEVAAADTEVIATAEAAEPEAAPVAATDTDVSETPVVPEAEVPWWKPNFLTRSAFSRNVPSSDATPEVAAAAEAAKTVEKGEQVPVKGAAPKTAKSKAAATTLAAADAVSTPLADAIALTDRTLGRLPAAVAQLEAQRPGRWQFASVTGTQWFDMRDAETEEMDQAMHRVKAELAKASTASAATKSSLAGGSGFKLDLQGDGTGTATTTTAAADAPGGPGVIDNFRCGRALYTIDFAAMTQTNKKTKRSRPIRRQPTDAAAAVLQTSSNDGSVDERAGAEKDTSMKRAGGATIEEEECRRGPRGDRSTYMGHGEVDDHSRYKGIATVCADESGLLMCMLNKADIKENNNKFYFTQVLKLNDPPKGTAKGPSKPYVFYTRYGRVGAVGAINEAHTETLEAAAKLFKRKFYDKTGNSWEQRNHFTIKPDNYALMRIDNRTPEEREAENGPELQSPPNAKAAGKADATPVKVVPVEPPSKLHPLLKDLMEYITDRSDTNEMLAKDFSLDVKRMPLGRINAEQIRDAYRVLTELDKEIQNPLSKPQTIVRLSNMFYTLLPHIVSTQQRLPPIDNGIILQNKLDLLQTLGDIEVANAVMAAARQRRHTGGGAKPPAENRLDRVYRALGCDMTPLADTDPIVQRIKLYTALTTGPTHNVIPEVETVFAVRRPDEEKRAAELFEATKTLPHGPHTNKRMLWHGSRKANFVGILSQGLRIAPPEAPSTGYMFGKGIYFSDVVTKASNYCHPMHNKGLMVLSEVALGKMYEIGSSEFMLKAKDGYFSTKGVGRHAPVGAGQMFADNPLPTSGTTSSQSSSSSSSVLWPLGRVEEIPAAQLPVKHTSLIYPEYIIYHPAQYQMRYLVRMRFRRA